MRLQFNKNTHPTHYFLYIYIGRKILFRVGLAILDSATTILLDCNTTKQLKHTLNSVGSHFGNISPIMKV